MSLLAYFFIQGSKQHDEMRYVRMYVYQSHVPDVHASGHCQ